MPPRYNRRQALKTLAAASGAALFPRALGQSRTKTEIQITTISPHTFRLTILPLDDGKPVPVSYDGSLVRTDWGSPTAILREIPEGRTIKSGEFNIGIAPNPLTFTIANSTGKSIQRLTLDQQTRALSFPTGDSPLFGLGEGGPQFDRRGSTDRMRSGQGGYKLGT